MSEFWLDSEISSWLPPAKISIPAWAEKYRNLGRDSAMKGLYKTSMVPFFVPEMLALESPDIRESVIIKSAQIGGTDFYLTVLAYYVCRGFPVMIVYADEGTAQFIGRNRIVPMFEQSDHLRTMIDWNNWQPAAGQFGLVNGGGIETAWASSVAKLGSRSKAIVYADEYAKYRQTTTSKEANPISLMEERMSTFPDAKFLKSSTPTDEASMRELNRCDVIYDWHVPCPYCGLYQPLRWGDGYAYGFDGHVCRGLRGESVPLGRVVWEGGREATNRQILETAGYQCGGCGKVWTTVEKNAAVSSGCSVPRWETDGTETRRGFHVNRLYSLFPGGNLAEIVRRWVGIVNMGAGVERDYEFQGFVNSTLAEPWEEQHRKQADPLSVMGKNMTDMEAGIVPADALVLVCAIDTQVDGFVYEVRAWTKDRTSYQVEHGTVLVDLRQVSDVSHLGALRDFLGKTWPVQGMDARMGLWRTVIDSGGTSLHDDPNRPTMTDLVYGFVRTYGMGRVFAVKGAERASSGKWIWKSQIGTYQGRKRPVGTDLFMISVNDYKAHLHDKRLDIEADKPGAWLFNRATSGDWVRGIYAERRKRDPKTGKWRWVVRRGQRNEPLDISVYQLAAVDDQFLGGTRHVKKPQMLDVAVRSAQGVDSPAAVRSSKKIGGWSNKAKPWV